MAKKFPFYKQSDHKDCGPTCLKIISKFYGTSQPTEYLRQLCETQREGSSMINLSSAAETLGFRSLGVKVSLAQLREAPLPCILHWNKNHYVVLYKIEKDDFYVADPAFGLLKYGQKKFLYNWIGTHANENTEEGISLLLEATPKLYDSRYEEPINAKGFSFLSKYLLKYKKFIWQLIIGLLAASLLQLIFPFLTQSIVDVGIKNQNVQFIYLVLLAQLALFVGRTMLEIIRGWILLHLSTRINISLVSDFFIKLMKLPIQYFDSRMTGDILQRINDHERIERIMTTSSLSVLFSTINLLVFGIVLAYYNLLVFAIFLFGSLLYFGWILIFLKKRRKLDYKYFSQFSQEQSKVIELINGMQTIKLNNAEKKKRWGWEFLQVRLFKISMQNLALEQYQTVGSGFINELKNILITVLSAKLVIEGELTLGMMLAISYIVGQLNSPILELINFIREVQDAKISWERLAEIHNKDDEEEIGTMKITDLSDELNLEMSNISFRYPGTSQNILKKLNLKIPAKKITAIVGASGSGKTTLLKLLLKFYTPNEGKIMIGSIDQANISQKAWRHKCGVVMQEDYIFNDSIANNIALSSDIVDKERLRYAVEVANIKKFIEELPLSYNTKIGMEGTGLSTGQKQRILIARAVYKNPDYIFLDEATSSLDANNESDIMEKLNYFFYNKTVVIVAHRLSTVKNANQIIVLDNGEIVEYGNHKELVGKRGYYFRLVKNQLELGE